MWHMWLSEHEIDLQTGDILDKWHKHNDESQNQVF